MNVPKEIAELCSREALQQTSLGLSGAGVWLGRELAVKAEPEGAESRTSAQMMSWLEGKLPMPQLRSRVLSEGMDWQVMSRLPGLPLCDAYYMQRPQLLAQLLAQALRMLWAVDVSGCPCEQSVEQKLAAARPHVTDRPVGGFPSGHRLLAWLEQNRPHPDPVLSHGDLCLPNILAEGALLTGFLDLGRAGIGDRYLDIAICFRSFRDNFTGMYGPAYPGFEPGLLFDALEIQPDWDKIRYYMLLDALF